jgi:hypothetical protein
LDPSGGLPDGPSVLELASEFRRNSSLMSNLDPVCFGFREHGGIYVLISPPLSDPQNTLMVHIYGLNIPGMEARALSGGLCPEVPSPLRAMIITGPHLQSTLQFTLCFHIIASFHLPLPPRV